MWYVTLKKVKILGVLGGLVIWEHCLEHNFYVLRLVWNLPNVQQQNIAVHNNIAIKLFYYYNAFQILLFVLFHLMKLSFQILRSLDHNFLNDGDGFFSDSFTEF